MHLQSRRECKNQLEFKVLIESTDIINLDTKQRGSQDFTLRDTSSEISNGRVSSLKMHTSFSASKIQMGSLKESLSQLNWLVYGYFKSNFKLLTVLLED